MLPAGAALPSTSPFGRVSNPAKRGRTRACDVPMCDTWTVRASVVVTIVICCCAVGAAQGALAQINLEPSRTVYIANSQGRIQTFDIGNPAVLTNDVGNLAGYAVVALDPEMERLYFRVLNTPEIAVFNARTLLRDNALTFGRNVSDARSERCRRAAAA